MTDDSGRLLVLGGHGRSGSEKSGPGEPHIANYANNDGWYDDTSDGPVMARLMMYAENVTSVRYVDVEYPAWVIIGYPRYVPEVLDMVTMDEVLYDLFVREFADDTALYGNAGTFDDPQQCRLSQRGRAAAMAGRPAHLEPASTGRGSTATSGRSSIGRTSSASSATSSASRISRTTRQQRGMFDPYKLSVVPTYATGRAAAAAQQAALARPKSSEMAPERRSGVAGRHPRRGRPRTRRSIRADAALSVRPAAACRRGERVQARGPHQQPDP